MSTTSAPPAPAAERATEIHERKRAQSTKDARRRRIPLLPALLFMIAATQLPFLVTVVVSFMDWRALRPDERGFTGLDNYVEVLTNPTLRGAVVTTVVLTLVVVLVSLVLGLLIALLLNRAFFGRGAVRTMMIAPFLIVPAAAALLWKHGILDPSYGLLNGALTWLWGLFGSDDAPQIAWLQDFPLLSIELTLIWQWTPFMMLILLAGLQSQPGDVIEAARMDGVNTWQLFRHITFPHLRRYVELGGLLGCIYVVQTFDAVYIMTAGALGTGNLPYTVYNTFFQKQDYGLASAQGVVVVLGAIVIATFALRVVSSLFDEERGR